MLSEDCSSGLMVHISFQCNNGNLQIVEAVLPTPLPQLSVGNGSLLTNKEEEKRGRERRKMGGKRERDTSILDTSPG